MSKPIPVDTLISARWVIPVETDTIHHEHSVAIQSGTIMDLLPTERALQRYLPTEHIDCPRHALLPGLVNAHTHVAMNLLRGIADDLPLNEWLQQHIWPAEARWLSEQFVRDGTRLAMAEMLRGGTTTFNDMYLFPDTTAQCVLESGMRAMVGLVVLDFPTPWAQHADEYLRRGLELRDHLKGTARVYTALAPHAPYTVSDAPLRRIAVLANELDLPVHMHVHETAHEIEESEQRHGVRPLTRLDRLGLVGPNLLAVHMTQLTEAEIELLAERRVNVLHCPESNLKLASGICPVTRLRRRGVNVALGTDGAASNNDLDLFAEMRTAALLAKGISGDARALNAHQVLRMATLDGARALGIDQDVGSIVKGKAADLIAVDLDRIETQPLYDPVSQLVYACGREAVDHVWVAGRTLLWKRRLTTLDETELLSVARDWQGRIASTHRV
ncbi:MAG: TRZ/ATZ family hydrolase [Thiotrichales bacterium]